MMSSLDAMPDELGRHRALTQRIEAAERAAHEGGRTLKIVFAIKSMSVQGGGAERVLAEITSGLAERGHQITVLTFDQPGTPSFYPLHGRIAHLQIGVGDSHRPARLFETARRMVAMRELLRGMDPDVVVGFMHSMFIPMGIALFGTGIPLVASEHIVPDHYKARPLQALLLRLMPWMTRRITVVSDQARAAYPAALRALMTVMPNPVSVHSSEPADVEGAARSRKTLLAVGRLASQKDHATLISAFARIAERLPDWDLRIVGEGEMRGELEAMVAALGLDKRVQMPGAIRDISSEYASAQLYVISSLYESQGLATAEALAHGLPAVGFADCPGTNKLIHNGCDGVLVRPNEDRADSLASALEPLMGDPCARLSLAPKVKKAVEQPIVDLFDLWTKMLHSVAGGCRTSALSQNGHGPAQDPRFQNI